MEKTADSLVVEFVELQTGKIGVATGPWSDAPDERMALDLLGGLRVEKKTPASLMIYDVGHSDCRWYTTFEAVRGIDLPDFRRLTPDPQEAVVSPYVVYHLAAFLSEVGHDWSHITRPEHVVLAETGELRVAYFEAYARGSCDSLIDRNRPDTDWHDMLAPELFRTEDRTEGMMVYALGVLLAHLITGKRPLRRTSARATVVDAIARTTPVSALLQLPEGLSRVVDTATHPTASHRLQSLAELRDALEPYLSPPETIARAIASLIEAKSALTDDRLRFCL